MASLFHQDWFVARVCCARVVIRLTIGNYTTLLNLFGSRRLVVRWCRVLAQMAWEQGKAAGLIPSCGFLPVVSQPRVNRQRRGQPYANHRRLRNRYAPGFRV